MQFEQSLQSAVHGSESVSRGKLCLYEVTLESPSEKIETRGRKTRYSFIIYVEGQNE